MSINLNEKNDFNVPTLSNFLRTMRSILKLNIPQNEQVEKANDLDFKIKRFNTPQNIGEKDRQNQRTLGKIILCLQGLSIGDLEYESLISEEEKNALEVYERKIKDIYELIEIIISSLQARFAYKASDSISCQRDYLQFIVAPLLVIVHDLGIKLPAFVPINYLSEILHFRFFLSYKNQNMLTISKKYLKDKIKKLIEENQIDLSDMKNQDARAVLIEQIKDMKDDSIITPNSIYNYAQQFLEKINKKNKKYRKNIIYELIGAFNCCAILLRINKYLNDNFIFFMYQILSNTYIYQITCYPSKNTKQHQLTIKIEEDWRKKIEEFFKDKNLNNNRLILKMNLHLLHEHSYYLKNRSSLDASKEVIKDILSCITIFEAEQHEIISLLLEKGIEYSYIGDQQVLEKALVELRSYSSMPYYNGIKYFIKSVIALKLNKLNEVIQYSDRVIKEESTKWHLGKLVADSIVINVSIRLMKGKIRPMELKTLLNKYHDCKESDIYIALFSSGSNSDGNTFNKSFHQDYSVQAYEKYPETDNEKDKFFAAQNAKLLLEKFHNLALLLDIHSDMKKLDTHLLPKDFGKVPRIFPK